MSSIRALSPKAETKRLSMSRASAAQTVLPLGDQPQAVHGWDQVLMAAFADPDRASGFLPQAEEAVRAHPGDGLILLLAATAALLDQNPERAQIFLKRFSKRFVAIAPFHLLRALVLEEGNNLASARSVLEANGLANGFDALQVFPGGWTRRTWLFRDRKSTRLNSSHANISYAVFCLKKKK